MKNFFVTLIFSTIFLALSSRNVVHGTYSTSPCSQTPYPEVCNHFVTNLKTEQFSLRDLSFQATMDQAKQAHQLVLAMDMKTSNKKAKLALKDCIDLYEDTIHQLNRSMSSQNPLDHLTWLSASVANQQTCQNGFSDFNMLSHLESSFPSFMLSNFSKLLSNSLAITKASASTTGFAYSRQVHGRRLLSDGFPDWLSVADRKLLQLSGTAPTEADIIVAQDGSGNYKTISEAVDASNTLSGTSSRRVVIYVKSGVYKENVEIERSLKNIMVIGDGIGSTIVTGNKNSGDSTTFGTATFGVSGDGFIAQDITFENTAGPQGEQAVALRCGADHSVFYRCSFKGYQDTLYVLSQRQFYRDCDVYGTVDFIFGDAVTVLQNCNIYVRKPLSGQKNSVTAQGRKDPNENTGIIIHNSRITASSDLRPVQSSYKTYLGRPWKMYSRTVITKSVLDGVIDQAGWTNWPGENYQNTLYYGEFMNTGVGASTGGRVNWPGFHVITSVTEAGKFTVGNFLAGGSWIPATGVPFDAGL